MVVLINSDFTLFITWLKCDILFYVEYSDYLYYLHCWENGVLHKSSKKTRIKVSSPSNKIVLLSNILSS